MTPVDAELSTEQAANLLNVSRPFVIKLIEQGKLPARRVGKHRQIRLGDALAYKKRSDEQRRAELQKLVREGQDLKMGY